MKRKFFHFVAAVVTAVVAVAWGASAALAQQDPNKFIEDLSETVIQQLKSDKNIQAGDLKRVSELVDTNLMPHVNFERMTALSVGRAWRQATPEQKKQLMSEFRVLLLRTGTRASA
jgi:phospholipid transport system substrate-binding protein